MPDNNGNYTLPPGYLATPGGVIRTSQHNPIFEDVRDALNRRLMTTGDNPMTGDLPMGGNKITGLSDPAAAQDGATKAYVDGEVTGLSNSLGTAATVDHGTDPGEVPLNSDLGSMSLEDAGDYVTKASKATQGQAEGGVTGDVWMDDIRVRQALEYKSLGWGQTWVDVTGSRVRGTSYQNTTGRPIMVVTNANGSSADSLEVSENGTSWVWTGRAYNTTADRSQAYAVVPSGHYYRMNGTGTPNQWSELR